MDELSGISGMVEGLAWLDYAIVIGSVAMLFVIAYFTGRKEDDTRDYFIGGRQVPGAIACLSFVATEISAVTIVAVPAIAFSENWNYLQFFIGSAAARILIAFLFIPAFYKYNCVTIYEFLKHRFGAGTQYAGSVFFFITRLLGSAIRLLVACTAVAMILGWDVRSSQVVIAALGIFTVVSIAFIGFGGIKAVVWNGAFESLVFYAAGLGVVGYLLWHSGGVGQAWQFAAESHKLDLFNWKWDFSTSTTFAGATLNAFFIGLAVFGTDQEMMQRLLTVKTRRSSQKALIYTILAALPLLVTYLTIGTLLFVFYKTQQLPEPELAKNILSHFTVTWLPMGLKGLVLAAVILASIDSPLSSLSSSFTTDIYRTLLNRRGSERHYLWVSRLGVLGFGLVLAALAYAFRDVKEPLWFAFQVIGLTAGSTLGIFLLGLLTKRVAGNRGNILAMTGSAVLCGALLFLSQKKFGGPDGKPLLELGWTWIIVIGTVSTFAIAYLLGRRPEGTAANGEPDETGSRIE